MVFKNKAAYPYLEDRDFTAECIFSSTRSRGPGGQHVNKVNTRVELRFNVRASSLLTDTEKEVILKKLKSSITSEGNIIIVSQDSRSQIRNKENVVEKLNMLLNKALTPRKKRIPTKPTEASQKKRLEQKHIRSGKKSLRKSIDDN